MLENIILKVELFAGGFSQRQGTIRNTSRQHCIEAVNKY